MWEKVENYIPLEECKNGCLYKVLCRNAYWGIFSSEQNGFIISRQKFNQNFLDVEYHWDYTTEYGLLGTAKPIEESIQVVWDMPLDDDLILEALNELPEYNIEDFL